MQFITQNLMVTSILRTEAAHLGAGAVSEHDFDIQTSLKSPELYFGANCIPNNNEFFQMKAPKNHKFDRKHLPNVRSQGWQFMYLLLSLFRCFHAKVQNNMREFLTIRHLPAIYFDFPIQKSDQISSISHSFFFFLFTFLIFKVETKIVILDFCGSCKSKQKRLNM